MKWLPEFIVMSYDNSGFAEARDNSEIVEIVNHADFLKQVEELIAWGCHDLFTNNCTSFQIYNEAGEIIFDSAIESSEVACVGLKNTFKSFAF